MMMTMMVNHRLILVNLVYFRTLQTDKRSLPRSVCIRRQKTVVYERRLVHSSFTSSRDATYVYLVYYTSFLHSTMIFTCINVKKTNWLPTLHFIYASSGYITLEYTWPANVLPNLFSIFGPKPMSYGWLHTSRNVHSGRASWRTRCSCGCARNRNLPTPERRWHRCRAPQPPAAMLCLTIWDCKVGHLITAVSNRAALPAVGWDDRGGMPRCEHYQLSDAWCAPSGSVRTSTLAAATPPRCHRTRYRSRVLRSINSRTSQQLRQHPFYVSFFKEQQV